MRILRRRDAAQRQPRHRQRTALVVLLSLASAFAIFLRRPVPLADKSAPLADISAPGPIVNNNKSAPLADKSAPGPIVLGSTSSWTTYPVDGGFCGAPSSPKCPAGVTAVRDAVLASESPDDVLRSDRLVPVALRRSDGSDASFEMQVRDPAKDKFISGTIAGGGVHDEPIRDLVVSSLPSEGGVFVDAGANIGYFTATALAVGASLVISFEPFHDNALAMLATVQKNGWRDRVEVYMNALGNQSERVTMKPTSGEVNLSNMHVTGRRCITALGEDDERGVYGVDYMDVVSLDQVFSEIHPDVERIHLLKVDVETAEIEVINGAMATICNVIVERIVMEVEYLKPSHGLPIRCDFDRMADALIRMGYVLRGVKGEALDAGVGLDRLPHDVLFELGLFVDKTRTPAERLRGKGGDDNPCAPFDRSSR